MNCQAMETQLIAYMDGRATQAERAGVESHAAACAACHARLAEFRALWGVLEEAPAREVSPAFDARLREKIAAGGAAPWWTAWIPQPRLALALSLLLAFAVWMGSLSIVKGPAAGNGGVQSAQSDEDFKVIKDLQVLEDYDVLAGMQALAETPQAGKDAAPRKM